jgi:RNA polymerase sigma factor (sigma-70 family)
MPAPEKNAVQKSSPDGLFTTTHWTAVLSASQMGSPESEAALATLCETYWYPLYVFVRRQGHGFEDAQDLVQGFFAKVLEKNYFQDADQVKGKFRSFLLLALKRFIANEWDRESRQKRGGGRVIVSLDQGDTETRYRAEPADEMTPEKAFERRWAITLLNQVLTRLECELAAAQKSPLFNELKVFLSGDQSEVPRAEIASRLGLSDGALRGAIHRLRCRYRELLRAEIAHTVDSPGAIDAEIRQLFAALS